MNLWQFLLTLGFWQWLGVLFLAEIVFYGTAAVITAVKS